MLSVYYMLNYAKIPKFQQNQDGGGGPLIIYDVVLLLEYWNNILLYILLLYILLLLLHIIAYIKFQHPLENFWNNWNFVGIFILPPKNKAVSGLRYQL